MRPAARKCWPIKLFQLLIGYAAEHVFIDVTHIEFRLSEQMGLQARGKLRPEVKNDQDRSSVEEARPTQC